MYKLLRLYNQNRAKIWTLILIIALLFIVLRVINYYVKQNNEEISNLSKSQYQQEKEYLNTITQNNINLKSQKSVVSGNKIQTKTLQTEVSTIKNFLDACNEQKISEAYNMLTEECKELLYSTEEEFEKYYYNDIFNNGRLSYEIENWINSTYKIDIVPDMLATGKSNNGIVKQDHITVEKKNDEYKLNINNYVGRKQINTSEEKNGITIKINYRDIYMDNEIYNITVTNNSGTTILVDGLESQDTMYLEDDKGLKYLSYYGELTKGSMQLGNQIEKNMEIRYYSGYTSSKEIKKVVFSQVIIDYGKYLKGLEGGTIEIGINL